MRLEKEKQIILTATETAKEVVYIWNNALRTSAVYHMVCMQIICHFSFAWATFNFSTSFITFHFAHKVLRVKQTHPNSLQQRIEVVDARRLVIFHPSVKIR